MTMLKTQGVTLIELMMVVAIVGILAAIAYPSYREQVIRTNRTEAKALLMQVSQQLEKCYTRTRSYKTCVGDMNIPGNSTDRYALAVDADKTTNTQFLINATPQGAQADDTRCGTLSLNGTGQKDKSGSGSVKECW